MKETKKEERKEKRKDWERKVELEKKENRGGKEKKAWNN